MTNTASKKPARGGARRPGSVRIIAGKWRRRRLKLPHHSGLRPTPDRVRETLFSWLMPVLAGSRCLDLFAGSGALGFEAASRGAGHVTMVEHDPALAALLEDHRRMLSAAEVQVVAGDALRWMETAVTAFDVIFLDPPFSRLDLGAICAEIERRNLIAPEGYIYLEHDVKMPPPSLPSTWDRYRSQRAGQVRYDLAVRNLSGETA